MDDNEQFVRARWKWIVVRKRDDREDWEWFGSLKWQMTATLADTEAEAWSAARAFTEARLESIRLVEEEVAWVTERLACPMSKDCETAKRILAREQKVLEELQRGMKKD